MITILQMLYAVVLMALGMILGRRYVRTRNIGYIVLALALPVWPLLSWASTHFVHSQIDLLVSGKHPIFPFSLLDGRMTVGQAVVTLSYTTRLLQVSLILIGFVLLMRSPRSPNTPELA